MELLIDPNGDVWRADDRAADDSVMRHGVICLRSIGRSLVIALHPPLLRPVAMAETFYAIADFDPERTFIVGAPNRPAETFGSVRDAIRYIHALAVAAGCIEDYPDDWAGSRDRP